MNWLRKLLGMHVWRYHGPHNRKCVVCGRREENRFQEDEFLHTAYAWWEQVAEDVPAQEVQIDSLDREKIIGLARERGLIISTSASADAWLIEFCDFVQEMVVSERESSAKVCDDFADELEARESFHRPDSIGALRAAGYRIRYHGRKNP